MQFEIEIKVRRDRSPEKMAAVEKGVARAVAASALRIERELKTRITEPKSGRTYKRGRSGSHTASAPGEAPATDSGNLIGSIAVLTPSDLEARIGTPVKYALYLEDGTSKMSPRPLWAVTRDDMIDDVERIFEAEMRKANAL